MQKATRQQIKEHNTRLVLKTIYSQQQISRADIARSTRLTRTTVSDIVGDLINDGLLVEAGLGSSLGGKPPILLNIVDDSRQFGCVDLSNDEFQGALVNLRGTITKRIHVDSTDDSEKTSLDCLFKLVDSLIESATSPLVGIGIGSPGLIDTQNGIVRQAVNLGWKNLPLKSLLEERYGLPIYIANDSHVAALAEYTFGRKRQVANMAVIKVGPGVGAGIVVSGEIYYGDGFNAGEIGHIRVVEDGSQCMCGNFGCLETVSSTRAILRQARALPGRPASLSMEEIIQAYNAGDAEIQAIVNRAGHYLGIAIASLIGILDIHHIVISGSPICFGEPFLAAVREPVRNQVLSTMADAAEISCSSLGSDNVILGASALVLSLVYGLP
jgi:N-acetylglucosamine repressor